MHFKDFPKSTMVLSNLEEKVNVAPCRENGSSSLSFVVDGRSCAFVCFSFYMNGLFVRSGISQNHSLLFEGLKCRSLGYSSELNVNVEDYRTYLKPRIDHDKQFIEDKFPERLSRILAT